jgi:hypothetical protein
VSMTDVLKILQAKKVRLPSDAQPRHELLTPVGRGAKYFSSQTATVFVVSKLVV